jgi:hypothetical protein
MTVCAGALGFVWLVLMLLVSKSPRFPSKTLMCDKGHAQPAPLLPGGETRLTAVRKLYYSVCCLGVMVVFRWERTLSSQSLVCYSRANPNL